MIDVTQAFTDSQAPRPDDRAERIAILKRYHWRYSKETQTFVKGRFRMSSGVVRLLPLADLEHSAAFPERVWPEH